jgi:hypothetical protein
MLDDRTFWTLEAMRSLQTRTYVCTSTCTCTCKCTCTCTFTCTWTCTWTHKCCTCTRTYVDTDMDVGMDIDMDMDMGIDMDGHGHGHTCNYGHRRRHEQWTCTWTKTRRWTWSWTGTEGFRCLVALLLIIDGCVTFSFIASNLKAFVKFILWSTNFPGKVMIASISTSFFFHGLCPPMHRSWLTKSQQPSSVHTTICSLDFSSPPKFSHIPCKLHFLIR